jgi:DNA-binding CsgD family transcriptional regulator
LVNRELVKKLLEDGEKFVYISRVTGCPLGSIRMYAEREVSQKERWTDEESKKLVMLRDSGLSYKKIAAQLNRTVNAVKMHYYTIVEKYNLTKPVVSRRIVNVELIIKMLKEGFKADYIAKEAGCTGTTVYNIKEAMEIEGDIVTTKWTTESRIKAMEMRLDGKSYSEIAKVIGHSRNSIRQEVYNIKKGRRSVNI